MHVPVDEGFLRWAEQAVGTESLIRMIRADVAQRVAQEKQTDVFNRLGIRGHWERAIVHGVISNYADLATVIRVAELPVVVQTRTPWYLVRADDELAVILGVRAVDIPEVSHAVRQRGIGVRDAQAQAAFANVCRRLRLDADVLPHLVPSDWAAEQAQSFLTELCARPQLGAVVVLGSPVVNPLAEPLVREALGNDRPSPARFRWGFDPGPATVLSVPGAAGPHEEGIVIEPHGGFFSRVRDDTILTRLAAGDDGPFPDCGLLLLDARCRPLRVLCAGHGGCGTVAAVETLGNHALIAHLLAASTDPGRSLFGPNLVLLVVAAERRSGGGMSPRGSPIDDLVIARRRVVWSSTLIEDLDV